MADYSVEDFRGQHGKTNHPKVQVLFVLQTICQGQNKTFMLLFIYGEFMRRLFFSPIAKQFVLGYEYASIDFLASYLDGRFEVFKVVEIHHISFKCLRTNLEQRIETYRKHHVELETIIDDGSLMEAFQRELRMLHGLELETGTSEEELGKIILDILHLYKNGLTPEIQKYVQEHGIVIE